MLQRFARLEHCGNLQVLATIERVSEVGKEDDETAEGPGIVVRTRVDGIDASFTIGPYPDDAEGWGTAEDKLKALDLTVCGRALEGLAQFIAGRGDDEAPA